MKILCFVVSLMLSTTHARFLPDSKAISKRNVDDAQLMANLSKIKTLLQKLENAESESIVTTTLATTKPQSPDVIGPREPMRDNVIWKDSDDNVDDTQNESILPKDKATLRELKRILEAARRQHYKSSVTDEIDEDMDDLSDRKTIVKEISWREIAKKLQQERDQLYIQKKQDERKPIKVKATTKEGYFLPLEETPDAVKDEIRASIEKNLMTDLALAFHSGISVNDIIKDLTNRVKPNA